jgi:hypothetical protein
MSNYLDYCRAYSVRVYEKKSGRYYMFSVVAESKSDAISLVEDYAAKTIGSTCIIKKATKLPNKPQVLDYRED